MKFKGRSSLKQYMPKNQLKEVLKYGQDVMLQLVTCTSSKFIVAKVTASRMKA